MLREVPRSRHARCQSASPRDDAAVSPRDDDLAADLHVVDVVVGASHADARAAAAAEVERNRERAVDARAAAEVERRRL